MTEYEMVGWHHQLNGHEFEQTLGDSEGKRGLSSVQSLSHVRLFVTSWTAAHQDFLSITNSRSLLKLMSIESMMPSNHLILLSPSPPAFNLSQH